jgi:general secretion pathway protein G
MKRVYGVHTLIKITKRLLQTAVLPGTKRQSEEGLTLIETIIVIGIIVAFATLAIVALAPMIGTSNSAVVKNQIASFKQALEIYRLNCGTYPSPEQGLSALRQKPAIEPVPEGWRGPYIDKKEIPKDPWGNEYKYLVPGPEGDAFGIISYGADGVEGGDGDNKDIKSWE